MNATKSALRTFVTAAAAGALVLGSAAGATAHPSRKADPRPQLQVVNFKGHTPLNVFDIVAADNGVSLRPITLRATVRDKAGAIPPALPEPATVVVTLDAYDRRMNGAELKDANGDAFDEFEIRLAPKATKSRVNKHFEFTYKFLPGQAESLANLLKVDPTPYLCIADADIVGYLGETTMSKQTRKRLDQMDRARGKVVRDCVKVVNIDPTLTRTTKDDPTAS